MTSSSGSPNLEGNKNLNSSLAIDVLQELSSGLEVAHGFSKSSIANLRTLNKSIHRVVMLGAEVLETRWEQWLILDQPGGYTAQTETGGLPQNDHRRLANLQDRACARLSTLKNVQARFSNPVTEALTVTSSDYERLNEQINNLVTGRGWTRLIWHQEKWVLDWYYFSFRIDLPAWLNSLAQNLTIQLDLFAKINRAGGDIEEQVHLASWAHNNQDKPAAGLWESMGDIIRNYWQWP